MSPTIKGHKKVGNGLRFLNLWPDNTFVLLQDVTVELRHVTNFTFFLSIFVTWPILTGGKICFTFLTPRFASGVKKNGT